MFLICLDNVADMVLELDMTKKYCIKHYTENFNKCPVCKANVYDREAGKGQRVANMKWYCDKHVPAINKEATREILYKVGLYDDVIDIIFNIVDVEESVHYDLCRFHYVKAFKNNCCMCTKDENVTHKGYLQYY